MGTGKNDVGVGAHAWKCEANTAAYTSGEWQRHNPNAGVGILKASHCLAVCKEDLFCAAFVYIGEGNPNATDNNPTGLMPGSCWKYSTNPWPKTTPLTGFVTCWKPGVTKPSGNSTGLPTSPVLETVVVPAVPGITGNANTMLNATLPDDDQMGTSGHPWMWVLGLGAVAVVGAIAAAVFFGACGSSDKGAKKKKKSSKRTIKASSQEEAEPFVAATPPAAASPHGGLSTMSAATAPGVPIATYASPLVQYGAQPVAGSFVQMVQPGSVVYATTQ